MVNGEMVRRLTLAALAAASGMAMMAPGSGTGSERYAGKPAEIAGSAPCASPGC